MFELVLAPIVNAVKVWMSERTYQAAKQGAADGLRRFASEFSEFADGVEALPIASPQAMPLTMASAAQVVAAPADRDAKIAEAKRLAAAGKPQRDIAAELGVAQSTVNGWLKDN